MCCTPTVHKSSLFTKKCMPNCCFTYWYRFKRSQKGVGPNEIVPVYEEIPDLVPIQNFSQKTEDATAGWSVHSYRKLQCVLEIVKFLRLVFH